jgi:hypothetical protein
MVKWGKYCKPPNVVPPQACTHEVESMGQSPNPKGPGGWSTDLSVDSIRGSVLGYLR